MASNETKITLDELEELLEEEQNSRSSLNFRTIFSILVLNWQYFLLCGALLYLRYTEPTYQMSARILIKDDQSRRRPSSQMLSNMQDLGFLTNSSGIDNEIEVLQSRILLRDVVRDLKLYSEYRTNGRIRDYIAYGTQPVNVDLDPAHLDSLDRVLVEGGVASRMSMNITRKENGYLIEGVVYNRGLETPFARKTKTLPAR